MMEARIPAGKGKTAAEMRRGCREGRAKQKSNSSQNMHPIERLRKKGKMERKKEEDNSRGCSLPF
jgi:hypothetical protein